MTIPIHLTDLSLCVFATVICQKPGHIPDSRVIMLRSKACLDVEITHHTNDTWTARGRVLAQTL